MKTQVLKEKLHSNMELIFILYKIKVFFKSFINVLQICENWLHRYVLKNKAMKSSEFKGLGDKMST